MGTFDGICFSEKFPYSYENSWKYIEELTETLDLSDVDGFENFKWKKSKPKLEKESAWATYCPKGKNFRNVPHFTLSLTYDALQVSVTMPITAFRQEELQKNFKSFIKDDRKFLDTLVSVRKELPNLWIFLRQQHAKKGIWDGYAFFV